MADRSEPAETPEYLNHDLNEEHHKYFDFVNGHQSEPFYNFEVTVLQGEALETALPEMTTLQHSISVDDTAQNVLHVDQEPECFLLVKFPHIDHQGNESYPTANYVITLNDTTGGHLHPEQSAEMAAENLTLFERLQTLQAK